MTEKLTRVVAESLLPITLYPDHDLQMFVGDRRHRIFARPSATLKRIADFRLYCADKWRHRDPS